MSRFFLLCIAALLPAFAGKKLDLNAPFILLSHKKSVAMDEQITAAAKSGFHIVAMTQTADGKTNVLMEKQKGDKAEYKFVRGPKLAGLKGRIEQAGREGFKFIPGSMMVRGKIMSNRIFMLAMEKDLADKTSYDYRVLISKMDSKMMSVLEKLAAEGFSTVGIHTDKDNVQLILMEKKN